MVEQWWILYVSGDVVDMTIFEMSRERERDDDDESIRIKKNFLSIID